MSGLKCALEDFNARFTKIREKEHDNDQLGEKSVKKEQKCIWTYDIPFGAKIGLHTTICKIPDLFS